MAFGGVALKSMSMFWRFIQFCCAAMILGVSVYYLVILHNHGLAIATYIRAVTGISGAAVLYTLTAMVLVCCLGGITFFSLIGMLLDLAFAGAFIYIAYAYRHGTDSCSGTVTTPLGTGDSTDRVSDGDGGFTHLPSLYTACKTEKAAFSVAIVGIFFFLTSILIEVLLTKHHKKEKAFGPSPNNGYTAGTHKRKFWQRKQKNRDLETAPGKVHPDALPADRARESYATDATAVGDHSHSRYGHNQSQGAYQPMTTNGHQSNGTNF
ncbi:hypothetical protein BJ878DRAFT_571484 [Calycina marina]|uniref:MARVEL domain-containing protein n=1 Tax=Calycina marina TaxID=1763456 RepID=A0A9P7YVC0_9HELO|nr:hypothetical protein BJ878DRAFT_571484 [Calycina marina]